MPIHIPPASEVFPEFTPSKKADGNKRVEALLTERAMVQMPHFVRKPVSHIADAMDRLYRGSDGTV